MRIVERHRGVSGLLEVGRGETGHKFYHYTPVDLYLDMQSFCAKENGHGGLVGSRSFGGHYRGLEEEAHEKGSFGLMEPVPLSWISNSEIPDAWIRLVEHVAGNSEYLQFSTGDVALISFNVLPEDRVYVIEGAEILRYTSRFGNARTAQDLGITIEGSGVETIAEAYRRYFESRVPMFDYKGGYSLPELFVPSFIEVSRLTLEWRGTKEELLDVCKRE